MSVIRRIGVAALALVAGIGASYVTLGTPVQALPGAQWDCAYDFVTISSDQGWQSLGVPVTINNGTATRNVVAQFTADMGVEPLAEVRLGYAIDGGAVQENVYGPANIANHADYYETRHTFAVITLGPGTHTVAPYWRVSAAPGETATVDARCFMLEGQTK